MASRPPKPASRPDNASWLRRIQLFRQDMFSSQPERLYRAWMAESRGPGYRSFLVNQPELVKQVLVDEQPDFPKSEIIRDTLHGLLGESVFVTNGEVWQRQRRIVDPAFDGGLKTAFPAMVDAGNAALERLEELANGSDVEAEFITSYLTADVIFRTLFSMPITSDVATEVFKAFREYQRAQPLWNIPGLLRLPSWMPRFRSSEAQKSSTKIRALLADLVDARTREIAEGTAPDDLATRIMTTVDPETGETLTRAEMVDQVAIFFLAGHETSASAMAWTLYLLADDSAVQEQVAAEAATLGATPEFKDISKLSFIRDVYREALRLYPPVPMMVRESARETEMRDRKVKRGSMVIVSPWHLQRHERIWERPDEFDPYRWQTEGNKACQRDAYIPFSKGPRVCTGAGFAMIEGVLLLAMLLKHFKFETTDRIPVPVAHLTVRAKEGIHLRVSRRGGSDTSAEHKP